MTHPDWLRLSDEVREALAAGRPVVALESSLIAQGLPCPATASPTRTSSS